MPLYRYRAVTEPGDIVEGEIEALINRRLLTNYETVDCYLCVPMSSEEHPFRRGCRANWADAMPYHEKRSQAPSEKCQRC